MKKIQDTISRFIIWFKQASLIKKSAVIIPLIILLYLIFRPHSQTPQYTTDTVKRGTVEDTVSESGNISTSGETDISSASTGIIAELYVQNGDRVSVGENLFKVKSTATPEDQALAYSTYLSAVNSERTAEQGKSALVATLEKDRKAVVDAQSSVDYESNNTTNSSTKQPYTQLEKDSLNSTLINAKEQFTTDEKKYNESDSAISAARAQVNYTWQAYQATQNSVVVAPVSGTIENLAYAVGDKVVATTISATTATTTSSPVLYIVTDSNSTWAKVQLNEVDMPKVKLGQNAVITLPAIANKTFNGHVGRIDRIGVNNSGVITFNVFIQIDIPDPAISPNMTVNVDIKTAKHENVLIVPNAAIKPYKGGKSVQVLDTKKSSQNKIVYIPVKTGIKGLDNTEIISGVKEGTVVITGLTQLKSATSTGGGG